MAQTGVQILFAFLLTLPFSSGFPNATAFQKDVYVVALIAAAFATAMIISPVAFHRALFRQGRKPELVRYAHRMATGGLAFMLVSMVSSVLLITDYLLNIWAAAIILTAITGALVPDLLGGASRGRRRNWIDEDAEEEDDDASSRRPSPTASRRAQVALSSSAASASTAAGVAVAPATGRCPGRAWPARSAAGWPAPAAPAGPGRPAASRTVAATAGPAHPAQPQRQPDEEHQRQRHGHDQQRHDQRQRGRRPPAAGGRRRRATGRRRRPR